MHFIVFVRWAAIINTVQPFAAAEIQRHHSTQSLIPKCKYYNAYKKFHIFIHLFIHYRFLPARSPSQDTVIVYTVVWHEQYYTSPTVQNLCWQADVRLTGKEISQLKQNPKAHYHVHRKPLLTDYYELIETLPRWQAAIRLTGTETSQLTENPQAHYHANIFHAESWYSISR